MDYSFEKQIRSINNNAFSQINKTSRRKPNLLETEDDKEYGNKTFNGFLNKYNVKRYSCYTDKGAVSAERFNRTIKKLMKKPVFLAGNADWISELPSVIKQNNKTIHSAKKITPNQAIKKVNKKMSIPIFTIEEIDNKQNLNMVSLLVQLI